MWNRRVRRTAPGRGGRGGGPAPHGVPRLRLRRHRPGPRRHGGGGEAGRQAVQPRQGAGRPPAAVLRHRDRAHPLGHARRAQRPERAPPPGRSLPGRAGAQRHHRELRRPARGARAGRSRPALRDRHRGRGPPAGGGAGGRPHPDRGHAARLPAAAGRVHAGGDRRAGPGPGRGGPSQQPPGRRDRAGGDLPGLGRLGLHRAHPRRARAGPGPGRDHHRGRRRDHRPAREAGARGQLPALPRRLGPLGGREGRLRLVHAQGDPRAAGRHHRLDAGPPRHRRRAAARRAADQRGRAARRRQDHPHRLRHRQLRQHGGQVRHRALDPDPVRGGAGPRVPLPRPDPDPGHPGGGHQPVRARPPTP